MVCTVERGLALRFSELPLWRRAAMIATTFALTIAVAYALRWFVFSVLPIEATRVLAVGVMAYAAGCLTPGWYRARRAKKERRTNARWRRENAINDVLDL